eukprot:SAG11_NODE_151_length_14583_cov_21.306200_18_plen_101_part_00
MFAHTQLEVSAKEKNNLGGEYELKSTTKSVARFYTATIENLVEELESAEAAQTAAASAFIISCFEEFDESYPLVHTPPVPFMIAIKETQFPPSSLHPICY